MRQTKVL